MFVLYVFGGIRKKGHNDLEKKMCEEKTQEVSRATFLEQKEKLKELVMLLMVQEI